jgi:hypothetical protein
MKQELPNSLNYDPSPPVAVVPYATIEDDPDVLPPNACNLCRRAPEISSFAHKNEALAIRGAGQDFAGIRALREYLPNSKICPAAAAAHAAQARAS